MDVACDACCIINFLAGAEVISQTGAPTESGGASKSRLYVPSEVARESLYLLQPDPSNPDQIVKTPIDLQLYFESGILRLCKIATDEENDLFVRLAISVDDGEAACLALAKCRGMAIATDDRLATRLAAELSVPVVNTPQFIHRWAEDSGASKAQISAAIGRIQRFAKFVPRRDADDSEWWYDHAS